MKILYTLLSLLLFLSTEAVTTYGGYITTHKSNKTDIEVIYRFTVDMKDSLTLADSIISTIRCGENSNTITVINMVETNRSKQYLNCARTAYKWQLTYRKTLDLNSPKYASLKGCCNLKIDAKLGKRSKDIKNLAKPETNFYIYHEFNNCNIDINTPIQSNGSLYNYVCIDQPYYYTNGTYDPVDYDSISYELVTPLSARNSVLTYTQGYSLEQPFKSNGSVFFEFNANYGEFSYWPNYVYDAGPVNFLIKEWRDDSLGNPYLISTTVKEIFIQQNQCPENRAPILSTNTHHYVCERDQLCFNIATNDLPAIPDPPAPTPPLDTVKLTWDESIPGASFTISDPSARLKYGTFCWTPPLGTASTLPYTFMATVRDNACPVNAITTRSFRITVKPKATVTRHFERINDSMITVNLRRLENSNDNYSYNLSLLDENRDLILDRNIGKFRSSNNSFSLNQIDTLVISKSKTFLIQTNANNSINCPTVYYDTLYFHTVGTNDVANTAIRVYPNPTNNLLHIDETMEQIHVYDLLGNRILSFSSAKDISVKNITNGVYILKAVKDGEIFTARFIKH